jgi:uncharacterized repeat protein (TIGR01451 family)
MSTRRWLTALLLTLVGVGSCDFATDVELLEIRGTGFLFGQAYLDLNGTGAADTGDEPLENVQVLLTAPGSGDVVLEATTDTLGVFTLESVPVGTYEVGLDASVLGDSLTAIVTSGSVTVEIGDTTQLSLGATYPTLTLEDVRTATPGRRVFTTGVAMNTRLASTDGTVHVLDTTDVAYLRTTGVELPTGNILVGDSVRLLGRTGTDNGQPVLSSVTPYVLQRGLALPPPVEATTGTAATADGGALDAALVRIRNGEISDTSTAPNGDFHFWANDGTDSVEVVFKWFRGISSSAIRPDTVVRISQATGLLTPYDDGTGSVRWRLLPRGGSEVVLEVKRADVAIASLITPDTATTGDTVQIRVTAQNLPTSTHTATGVAVTDQVPTGLTFLSATVTGGSYTDGTGVWDVGELAPGAADTLLIDAEVTATPPDSITNTAVFGGLVDEVETNSANDSVSVVLTVN